MALEVLLDLPDEKQRQALKDEVERLCNNPEERRYKYGFEKGRGRGTESRSLKGMWADRFYTLRNHLIHGNAIKSSEWMLRGKQHHLDIAPKFFVLALKRMIDEVRASKAKKPAFYLHLNWKSWIDENEEPPQNHEGFSLEIDFAARLRLTHPELFGDV